MQISKQSISTNWTGRRFWTTSSSTLVNSVGSLVCGLTTICPARSSTRALGSLQKHNGLDDWGQVVWFFFHPEAVIIMYRLLNKWSFWPFFVCTAAGPAMQAWLSVWNTCTACIPTRSQPWGRNRIWQQWKKQLWKLPFARIWQKNFRA